jgi:hypothetical protein
MDAEGSGRGLILMYYSGICLKGLTKTKANFTMVGAPAEIRTEHLPYQVRSFTASANWLDFTASFGSLKLIYLWPKILLSDF